jgi:hypothetical protein
VFDRSEEVLMPTTPTQQELTEAIEFAKRLAIILACVAVTFVTSSTVAVSSVGGGAGTA